MTVVLRHKNAYQLLGAAAPLNSIPPLQTNYPPLFSTQLSGEGARGEELSVISWSNHYSRGSEGHPISLTGE
jgi:hypothetical protein